MLKRSVLAVLLFGAIGAAQVNTVRQYPIDTNHSTVGFSVSIMGGLSKVNGKFTEFAVRLTNDEKDITKSSVSVVIKAASINTGITARDNDLRSANFFDVEKYPEITFQSKHIEKKGKQLLAIGTFTMRGVSKEIALPFQITGRKQRLDIEKDEPRVLSAHCPQPQRLRNKLDAPEGSQFRQRQCGD